jgi:peptide/nickel transport system permease protein
MVREKSTTIRKPRARNRLGGELFFVGLILGLLLVAGLIPSLLAPQDPWRTGGPALAAPGGEYLLGTDQLGRDVWSRLIHGARTSLLVGGLATLIALVLGGLVGLISGTVGGWIDELLMRLAELVDTVPGLLLALLVITLIGAGIWQVALVIGLTGWTGLARVLRSRLVSIREEEFVLGARALGMSEARVALRHMLPLAWPALLALLPFRLEGAIMLEASLSFLGLGDVSRPSWGGMPQDAQPYLRQAWWLVAAPGAALALTLFALSLLSDHLQRLSNPKLRLGRSD